MSGVQGVTGRGRARWVYLTKPDEDGKKRVTLFLPRDDRSIKKMIADCENAARSEFGADVDLSKLAFPFRDADQEKNTEGEVISEKYPEMKGCVYFQAKTGFEVRFFDKTNSEVMECPIYAGCYARVAYNAKAWSMRGKKGVSLYLKAVQFVDDGEKLTSEAQPVEDLFQDETQAVEEAHAAI